MPSERVVVVDVDDLWSEDQIKEWLVPLHDEVPGFEVTAYAIPNKLGAVDVLRDKYPWITFAQHGFEHSLFECLSWVEPLALAHLTLALDMGYARLFKAPNWVLDIETERALAEMHIVLAPHKSYTPVQPGLQVVDLPKDVASVHTHIQQNPVTDFIGTNEKFTVEALSRFNVFASPLDYVKEI
jgi:hypothetical protein